METPVVYGLYDDSTQLDEDCVDVVTQTNTVRHLFASNAKQTRSSDKNEDGLKCNECKDLIKFSSSQQVETKRTSHMCKVCDKALHGYCGTNDGNDPNNRICTKCVVEWKKKYPKYVAMND